MAKSVIIMACVMEKVVNVRVQKNIPQQAVSVIQVSEQTKLFLFNFTIIVHAFIG